MLTSYAHIISSIIFAHNICSNHIYVARTAAVGTGAATSAVVASSSTTTASTSSGSVVAGRALTSGGATLGSLASSRAGSLSTSVAAGSVVASEIGSTSVESAAVLDTATLADASSTIVISGSENVLLGDSTTDAIINAASSSGESLGVDSLVVAAGDAGAGILSILPSWLVSGGLVALASELAFAIFALVLLLKAGGSAASEVVIQSAGEDGNKKFDTVQLSDDINEEIDSTEEAEPLEQHTNESKDDDIQL